MAIRGSGISAFMAIVVGLAGQLACGYTLDWTANCVNQYTQFIYDFDGNMTQCGDWTYTYDAANRLKTVSSNGVLLVTNFYDAKSRRVKKLTSEATTTFFYDGWNLIEERIAYTNGISSTIRYFWGKDLSGTLQGAGGVGGLLYLTVSNSNSQLQLYVPCYDNIGNITRYLDANGNIVAQYTYDTFGRTISETGTMAGIFRHRFSTKYYDMETGLYCYGYRFYLPLLMRWLNRDPMEEDGGNNLYAFCGNAALNGVDVLGAVKFKGKSNTAGFFYEFVVGKCEIAIIYGHGHKTLPHKISFEDEKSSSAYFWGCWPDITNNTIPKENRLLENVGRHNTMYDDEVFEQLKASREIAMRRAKEICEKECCKDGVWIRYQFSPSDKFGVRVLDWLKGNTSRNKPARLLMGGMWEGDTHVMCK